MKTYVISYLAIDRYQGYVAEPEYALIKAKNVENALNTLNKNWTWEVAITNIYSE